MSLPPRISHIHPASDILDIIRFLKWSPLPSHDDTASINGIRKLRVLGTITESGDLCLYVIPHPHDLRPDSKVRGWLVVGVVAFVCLLFVCCLFVWYAVGCPPPQPKSELERVSDLTALALEQTHPAPSRRRRRRRRQPTGQPVSQLTSYPYPQLLPSPSPSLPLAIAVTITIAIAIAGATTTPLDSSLPTHTRRPSPRPTDRRCTSRQRPALRLPACSPLPRATSIHPSVRPSSIHPSTTTIIVITITITSHHQQKSS